jgi:hypothetical protein
VLGVLPVAPFDNDELTSDTRIDLDPHHLDAAANVILID